MKLIEHDNLINEDALRLSSTQSFDCNFQLTYILKSKPYLSGGRESIVILDKEGGE